MQLWQCGLGIYKMLDQHLGKWSAGCWQKEDLHMSPRDDSVVEKSILSYPLLWLIKIYLGANFFYFQVSIQDSKHNKTKENKTKENKKRTTKTRKPKPKPKPTTITKKTTTKIKQEWVSRKWNKTYSNSVNLMRNQMQFIWHISTINTNCNTML